MIRYIDFPVLIIKEESITLNDIFYKCLNESYRSSTLMSDRNKILDQIRDCIKKSKMDISEKELQNVWNMYMNRNKKIINFLEKLKEHNLVLNERFKVKAYMIAINSIKKLQVPIISGNQARMLPGIGKRTAAKIDEILLTGDLEVVTFQSPEEKEKDNILKDFQSVWGIGPKKSLELYDEGYRNVKDIPLETLNIEQKIGLYYYDALNSGVLSKYHTDLKKTIPREQIFQLERKIRKLLRKFSRDIRIFFTGSYRRGLKNSEYINVLVAYKKEPLPNYLFSHILNILKKEGILIEDIMNDNDVYSGITTTEGVARRIDIHYVPLMDWGSNILYFTGSNKFNMDMKKLAIKKNMNLSEKGLFDDSNNRILAFTEDEIFSALDLPYIEPKYRTDLSDF